jgi:hypothetical protein
MKLSIRSSRSDQGEVPPVGAAISPVVYRAGEAAGPGCYREIERGILVRLARETPLPDLNSYQPSRFFPMRRARWFLTWLPGARQMLDRSVLYTAGQPAPPGQYRDIERGITVQLSSTGPLPDLQTGEPSRYRRLRTEKLRIRIEKLSDSNPLMADDAG